MVSILGIDEAGRGPVLGPLVVAGVKIDSTHELKLKEMGAKDSKLLKEEKRKELYPKILEIAQAHKVVILSPQEVDAALLSQKTNLNFLEADTMCRIISETTPDHVFMDCPSINTKKFTEYVQRKISCNAKITAEHKADLNYPVCSAASIIAKVIRDSEIAKIKEKIGIDCGSGYASDPVTQKFIELYYDSFPELFRKQWDTCRQFEFRKSQLKLDSF